MLERDGADSAMTGEGAGKERRPTWPRRLSSPDVDAGQYSYDIMAVTGTDTPGPVCTLVAGMGMVMGREI